MTRGRLYSLILAGALAGAGAAALLFFSFARPEEAAFAETDDIVRMPERPTTAKPADPNWVIFVKAKLSGTDDIIDIKYAKIAKCTLTGSSRCTDDARNIVKLVNKLVLKQYTPNWIDPDFEENPNDSLSRLSLQNDQNAYIVFELDCGNCRFVTKDRPFRIERRKAPHHYEPRVAWPVSPTQVEHEKEAPAGVEAKHGYFIAYSDEEMFKNDNKFRSDFNFYVELLYPDSKPVPISVDPDVGYPGGNK